MLAVAANSGCYKIGTGVETTVLQLSRLLSNSIKGYSIDVEHTDARHGEVQSISLDNSYSKENLGWSPQIDINEGISQTWKWFLENSTK